VKRQKLHFIPTHKVPCSSCNGTGEKISDDSNSLKLEECDICNGTGKVFKSANRRYSDIDLANDITNEDEEDL
jgi:DnaJ-class molecular chaperone